MRGNMLLIATAIAAGAFGASAGAGSLQPAKGVYSFHAYVSATSGKCTTAIGDTRNGSFVYPGPLKTGAVFTFGDSSNLGIAVHEVSKTPVAGAVSWNGTYTFKNYSFTAAPTTGKGTFSAKIAYATADSFMIEYSPKTGGCQTTFDIAAWHD
jgi:hypothetical protein